MSGSQESSPTVAISILNWNGWQDTLECLESVRRLDYPNYLTIVDSFWAEDSLTSPGGMPSARPSVSWPISVLPVASPPGSWAKNCVRESSTS